MTRNSRSNDGVDGMDEVPLLFYRVQSAAGTFCFEQDDRGRNHTKCNEEIEKYELLMTISLPL
jgi:hypothetical protein